MNKKLLVVKIIEKLSSWIARVLDKTPLWYPVSSAVIDVVRTRKKPVTVGSKKIVFHTPNGLNHFRAETLFDKEPETLAWIDGFDSNSVFWDVGACVGTYSLYSAINRKTKVIAIEPSVFNLEWLARNVNSNQLQDQVTLIPLALSNSTCPQTLKMRVTEWGGAMSSFGVSFDEQGLTFTPKFEYVTAGSRADFLITALGLPQPRYLKIDVDSIEHLILEGFGAHLARVKSLATENSRNPLVKSQCSRILTSAGFVCQHEGRANSIWTNPRAD